MRLVELLADYQNTKLSPKQVQALIEIRMEEKLYTFEDMLEEIKEYIQIRKKSPFDGNRKSKEQKHN